MAGPQVCLGHLAVGELQEDDVAPCVSKVGEDWRVGPGRLGPATQVAEADVKSDGDTVARNAFHAAVEQFHALRCVSPVGAVRRLVDLDEPAAGCDQGSEFGVDY